jgi:next-to-BRCA1 protein 1
MPAALSANAATQVQTVAEIKPVETKQPVRAASPIRHQAIFVRDSVTDGTAMPTNTIFEQVWTMRNPGPNDWPAGCSLACTGGDRMLNIDSNNPGSISDLDKALSSKPIDHVVKAGEEVSVAVTLRTPSRSGNYIGYWRLRSPEGIPFGHRLWCDIHAIAPPASPVMPKTDVNEAESVQAPEESLRESQMVFPTLEKESPYSSLHDDASHVPAAPSSISPEDQDFLDDVESLGLEDETTDDGFLTDEEYEILDSDSQNGAAHNGRA